MIPGNRSRFSVVRSEPDNVTLQAILMSAFSDSLGVRLPGCMVFADIW